eukprot:GGOE01015672.1.p1 GENE.GGOE01015672.1~~GGOE01015672.1.p1  ORF type:complete len:144 (-),score=27.39 GGOE01015672.1:395-787(-)
MQDNVRGVLYMLLLLAVYAYYTCWMLVTPFIDRDHFIQAYFPPRWIGCLIPTAGGMTLMGVVAITFAMLLIHGGPPGRPARLQELPCENEGDSPKDGTSSFSAVDKEGAVPFPILHTHRLVPRHQRILTW